MIVRENTNRICKAAFGLLFLSSASVCTAQTPTAEAVLEIDSSTVDSYQASATPVQDVLPVVSQRGVGLDGSLRSEAPFGWAVNANPFSHEWNDKARYRDVVMLETGRYSPTAIDLALPAPGFRWTVGRTYSLDDSGGPSSGHQGANWHQFSQPEVVFGSGDGSDRIYLVYGADRFIEFKRLDGTSTVYRGVNGAAGAIVKETVGSHDLLVYWDQHGKKSYFFDPRDADNIVIDSQSNFHFGQGQLWKIVDAAGNSAYVGDSTTPATAIETGYDANGHLSKAYDSAGRKYEYSYHSTSGLLETVEAFVDNGSGWETTGAKVEYTYHTGSHDDRGQSGWLRSATVTLPLPQFDVSSAPGEVETATSYYVYAEVHPHDEDEVDSAAAISGVVGPEGYRQFFAQNPSGNIDTVSLGTLDDYMSYEFDYYEGAPSSPNTYNFNDRWGYAISSARFEGLDDFETINFSYYEYETFIHAGTSGQYDPEHASFTVVSSSDSSESFWQYFDEVGQPLTRMMEISGGDTYVYRLVSRGEVGVTTGVDGMIEMIAEPLACEFSDVPNPAGASYVSPSTLRTNASILADSSDGALIRVFPRVQSGAYTGFVESSSWQSVSTPSSTAHGPHKLMAFDYVTPVHDSVSTADVGDDYLVVRPLIEKRRSYNNYQYSSSDPLYYDETTYAYEFHAEDINGGGTTDPADAGWLVPRKILTTHPIISTSNNGSGVAATSEQFFRADDTLIYRRDETGVYYYTGLENDYVVKTIDDVRLSLSVMVGTDDPADYFNPIPLDVNSSELRVTTTFTRDEVGREVSRTTPSGRVITHRYEELADGRLARVSSMGESGSDYLGPFDYMVWADNGPVDVDAKIGVASTATAPASWIDDSESDPILAASLGDLSEMTRYNYTLSGDTRTGMDVYHSIPASGSGTLQTHYDSEGYVHNAAGDVTEFTMMSGTIHTYTRDSRGYVTDRGISSYNPSPSTSSSRAASADNGGSSTDANGNDMGGDCNCTQSSASGCLHLGSGNGLGAGDFQISNDVFGRQVFVRRAEAPHFAYGYDNLGRLISVAVYDSDDFTADGMPPASGRDEINPDVFPAYQPDVYGPDYLTTNRVAYVSIDYDERGRVVRRTLHEVDANGATTSDSLSWEYTYDNAGRVVFENANGLVKRDYDRLGREVASYELSGTDDTAFADAFGVSGDVVERETHRILNTKTGQVLLESVTSRTEKDYGASEHRGALDSNTYSTISGTTIQPSNLEGRVQIVMYGYDELDRVTDRYFYGTGDTDVSSTFDPDAVTMPDSLRTQFAYDAAGRIDEIVDPMGRVETRAYDSAGRMVERVENFVASPTGSSDENRTTEWSYLNGQLIEYVAHDGGVTQTTSYGYAPGNTTDDDWPSREHLRTITYTDSDVEYFVYDEYDYIDRRIDAAGNEIKFSYDLPGRVSKLELTAATGFDGDVAAIEIGYSGLGRVASVTQLDSGSSEIDSVSIGYDGWSNLSTFTQDPDGSGGGFAAQTLTYVWELANGSGGRQAIRMSGKDFPGGADIDYNYAVSAGSNGGDSLMSRVSSIEYDAAVVAEYEYMGVDFVTKTSYPTNSTNALYSSLKDSSGSFDALDDFNRPVRSRWNRERAYNASTNEVPFYDITVHWDDNSNVSGVTDNVYTDFFNYEFENDGLNRLADSKRGAGSGNSVTLPAVEVESWGLSEIGVWDTHDLELTGDNPPDYSDAGEFKASGTFNSVNEMTALALDQDNDGTPDVTYTRSHNDRGDLTDDGENYTFVYDVLGRLVEIRNRTTNDLLSEYKYNGLGYRTGERIDTDDDGIIEATETDWRYFIYDAQWRLIEVYEDSDDVNPLEVYVHHAAGLDGIGDGSYIDHLVLRDRDTNADNTLDELHYYCQNWRADVVAVLSESGHVLEQVRYTPYGVPILIPFADQRADGTLNYFDWSAFQTRYQSGSYEVRVDFNLDGKLDFFDVSAWQGQYNASVATGRGVMSNYEHRFGYAGYWYVGEREMYQVRNRWYNPETGSWLTRDPLLFIDGAYYYGYVQQIPVLGLDPYGFGFWSSVGKVFSGAAAGAVTGAITGAISGAVVGAFGGPGGIVAGAIAGAGTGAIAGAVAGGVAAGIGELASDGNQTLGEAVTRGAFAGAAAGAPAGAVGAGGGIGAGALSGGVAGGTSAGVQSGGDWRAICIGAAAGAIAGGGGGAVDDVADPITGVLIGVDIDIASWAIGRQF